MMLVTKGNEITYITENASTLPDWAKKDKATLKEGIYTYNMGIHNQKYTCLRHDATPLVPCWYGQADGTFKEKNGSGINIHAVGNRRASLTGKPWSDGCQTVFWEDYVKFGKAVGFLDDKAPDIGSSGKINALGTRYSSSIKVTYILDRSNLPDNQKNMFYPEE